MKNILIALLLLTCLTGCEYERVKIDKPIGINIRDIEWDGHTYILVEGTTIDSGVCLIHSESCECKKNKED